MKKIVAMLLAICMMVTAFAGCGTSAASTSEGTGSAAAAGSRCCRSGCCRFYGCIR